MVLCIWFIIGSKTGTVFVLVEAWEDIYKKTFTNKYKTTNVVSGKKKKTTVQCRRIINQGSDLHVASENCLEMFLSFRACKSCLELGFGGDVCFHW